VNRINGNPNDAFIVETAITPGQRLGINVVAEGVEDVEQWKLLKSLGWGHISGLLF
jgi:EAL domain-containing protein (putative c-di-GMP-specific phosphodiesterase class I)